MEKNSILKCKNKNHFSFHNLKIYNKYNKYNKTKTILSNNDKLLIFKFNYVLLPELDLVVQDTEIQRNHIKASQINFYKIFSKETELHQLYRQLLACHWLILSRNWMEISKASVWSCMRGCTLYHSHLPMTLCYLNAS